MKKLTIGDIEQRLLTISDRNDPFVLYLESDERKGVKQLLLKWNRQKERKELAEQKFLHMSSYEKKFREQGFKYIAGIDEVGRGPLAGPVVTAAVILPESFHLLGIDDSKKLSEEKREEFYEIIMREAIAVNIGLIEAEEIDRINILEATKKAMLHAIAGLSVKPDFLLIDAVQLVTPYPQESIIKGDANSISIAAASIVAKVTRDRLMKQLDQQFPQYGFANNMGYGTKEHIEALKEFGATSHHRKSFAPVKDYFYRKE